MPAARIGAGMALTYADIRDPDGEDAVSAKVPRSSPTSLASLRVRATNAQPHRSPGGHRRTRRQRGSAALSSSTMLRRRRARRSQAPSGALATVSVIGGTVTVLADGSRIEEYDDLIAGRQDVSSTDASQVDFSGRSANGGTANPDGAAVLATAGVVQAGRNNAGIALLDNTVAQAHRLDRFRHHHGPLAGSTSRHRTARR